nr:DUF2867 domain-containing protein [Phocaeicola abscessus]
MKPRKIYACWIYVSDLQKSKQFYQDMGFEVKLTNGDWIEFNFGETSFAILQRPAHKGDVIASKTRIMFETDDIELVYEELKNKGVKTIGEIKTEPYGKLLTFEDPDGHWLEFYQKLPCDESIKMKLLPNSLISKYIPYDYTDSYVKIVSCQEPVTAEQFFDMAFNQPSHWVKILYRLRKCLVRPLKLDTDSGFCDMICEKKTNEIVFGKADKHLTFHTSLLCGKYFNGRQELRITTVVKYHNALGRIYFFFIRPFHIVIIKSLLKKIAKSI